MEIRDLSFAPDVREVYVADQQGRDYKILTLGKRSYIARAELESTGIVSNILIGSYCSIGHEVKFLINTQHDYTAVSTYPWNNPYNPVFACDIAKKEKNQILIGHDVWIGRGAVIFGGVRIGNGAVIAANAVVTKDVPPYAIVGGNPASCIKYRFNQTTVKQLNTIKWWYWPEEKIIENRDLLTKRVDLFCKKFYFDARECSFPRNEQLESMLNGDEYCYYLFMDFQAKHPFWKKNIAEYLQRFTSDDKKVLFIGVPFSENGEYAAAVEAFVQERAIEQRPRIVYVTEPDGPNVAMLRYIDAFITNKEFKSIVYVDFCQEYGITVLHGTDENIFS